MPFPDSKSTAWEFFTDDEFVALVRSQVCSERVRIKTDIALDDWARRTGDQFGERQSHSLQFCVGWRRVPGVCPHDWPMVVLRSLYASSLEIRKAVYQPFLPFDNKRRKFPVTHQFGFSRLEPTDRLSRDL
ncbi:hypothetical protein ACH79_15730 [Bradyrhizobium sp. CCBAU 051011]|nr:hypothetical protein ACH79_15730 [Bradyrhizobium sp. CCBAU 051011]